MKYETLQNRLRETYPNTWVGERNGKPVVATSDTTSMGMYFHVMDIDRNYSGAVMTSKNIATLLEWDAINWIDNSDAKEAA